MADTVKITLRLPREQLERIDQTRGLVPREPWIRAHLEDALRVKHPGGDEESRQAADSPPEQYRQGYGPDVSRLRSSGQAKAGVQPIGK